MQTIGSFQQVVSIQLETSIIFNFSNEVGSRIDSDCWFTSAVCSSTENVNLVQWYGKKRWFGEFVFHLNLQIYLFKQFIYLIEVNMHVPNNQRSLSQ